MMIKMFKRIIGIALITGSLAGTANDAAIALPFTDVIGKGAITSFKTVLDVYPDGVAANEGGDMWVLAAPDKTAFVAWQKKNALTNQNALVVWTSIKPFVEAGLNPKKLPKEMVSGDKVVFGAKINQKKSALTGTDSPFASFEQLVENNRSRVGYHSELDHYGINFSSGNAFEWAKDISKNDKDIVFVMNPQPFIRAGVNPQKVEGWVFGKITVEDANGKMVKVDRFLKPFNLK